MSQESAFEFVARIQRDGNFRHEYLEAKANCAAGRYLREMGFKFDFGELQVARKKLKFSPDDRELVRDLREDLRGKKTELNADAVVASFCGCEIKPDIPKRCY